VTIYKKRGHWCYRDNSGHLHKFATEEEAKSHAGGEHHEEPTPEPIEEPAPEVCEDCECDPCECEDGEE